MLARLYARFSTDRQTESSIHDQLRVCRDYAARHGWPTHEYTDEGISGAAQGNRPGWLAALAELTPGDVLLVTDTTRLSRSQELAPLIERLRFRGVRVIGVLDGFDSDSPQARMQAGLSGLMSDELRANIRARTHSALAMRALAGKVVTRPCYGFNLAGEPLESEAAVVRQIFAQVDAGVPLRQVALELNARAIPSPRSGGWRVSALHELLRNERLIGRVVWNRSQWLKDPDSGRRVRRERPPDQWIVTQGPVIIEAPVWERVQARLTERARLFGGRGPRPSYLLSGILTCAACGGRMIVTGNRGSHYYCGTHRHGGLCRMGVGARREVAERLILAEVHEALLSTEAVELAAELIHGWAREVRVPAPVTDYDRQIAELEHVAESHPLPAILEALEGLRERRKAAQRQAWRQAQAAAIPSAERAVAAYRATVADAAAELAAGGQPARELLRRCLGGDVRVEPDESGRHLIAAVGLDRLALIASDGSGGPLRSRATHIEYVRLVA